MKFRIAASIAAATVCAALAAPVPLGAQDKQAQKKKEPVRYTVTILDTLGGAAGGANSINNRGWVTGVANLPEDQVAHAALWLQGEIVDLDTLGGPNSAVSFPVKNKRGEIVGISETSDVDPLGETFSCAPFFGTPATGHSCQGFRWRDGEMTALPPFVGGNNSFGAGLNDRGQAVGWGENGVHDPTCTLPQVLQFRAAIWGPEEGQIQELPPLPGDSSSAATAINNKGQVVGISGRCDRAFGRFSARRAVLWEDGTVTDLGNFGGIAWNTPTAINSRGDVAGFSDFPGDEGGGLNSHAFLWTASGGIQDLDTLPDDVISLAFGINDKRQVVGQSIGASGSSAFLWQDGVIMDLNDLVPPGTLHLFFANDINDRGEIVGGALDSAGNSLPFLAVPVHGREAEAGENQSAGIASPETVRSEPR
jgi:probable HAF family extracellular repeat protein